MVGVNYKISEKNELKKHVYAVHCANDYSLVQRKLFDALLENAYDDLPHQAIYEISIKVLKDTIGYNSNDTKTLKKSLKELMCIATEWNLLDSNGENIWKATTLLASAEFKEGICYYEFSSKLRELLYHPKIYARIDMKVVRLLKTKGAIALYENGIRFQGLAQTPTFLYPIFRKLMGVSEDKYKDWSEFNRSVLQPALREVNKHSPIIMTPKIIKKGKKVIAIQFYLAKNTKKLTMSTPSRNELEKILIDEFKLPSKKVHNYLKAYGADYILEKIDYVKNTRAYISGKMIKLSGYLISAIEYDYKKENKEDSNKVKVSIENDFVSETRKIGKLYSKYITEHVISYWNSLEFNQSQLILDKFSLELQSKHSAIFSIYEQHGIEHEAITRLFVQFLSTKYDNMIPPQLSYKEFEAEIIG